jgi:hypothetical protein
MELATVRYAEANFKRQFLRYQDRRALRLLKAAG